MPSEALSLSSVELVNNVLNHKTNSGQRTGKKTPHALLVDI